jgi:hypothetical protein
VVYFDSLLQCKEAKRKSNQEQNYVKVFHANVSKVSNILVRDMWAMAKCIEEHLDHTAERPAKFSDRNSMEWVQPSIKFLEKKYSTYMFSEYFYIDVFFVWCLPVQFSGVIIGLLMYTFLMIRNARFFCTFEAKTVLFWSLAGL